MTPASVPAVSTPPPHGSRALGSGENVQRDHLAHRNLQEFIDLIMPAGHLGESTMVSPTCLQETSFREDLLAPYTSVCPLLWLGSLSSPRWSPFHGDSPRRPGDQEEGFESRVLFGGPWLSLQSVEVVGL